MGCPRRCIAQAKGLILVIREEKHRACCLSDERAFSLGFVLGSGLGLGSHLGLQRWPCRLGHQNSTWEVSGKCSRPLLMIPARQISRPWLVRKRTASVTTRRVWHQLAMPF